MVWQEFRESQIALSWPRWHQIWQNKSHHGLLIWAKGVPVRKGLNGSKQVLKFCGIGKPQTGLCVQSSVQPKLWTELRSSSLGFRFEPKFGTELQQHYHHHRTTPHLQLASQVHRWDGIAQRRCGGENWPNCCYTNMLTCKPHPTPVHFTKEPTPWGSSQWLTLQPSFSGPSLICTCCWIVRFSLPWHLSLLMSNDQLIACFELQMGDWLWTHV